MLSDPLSDAPRAALPSPVNLEEFLQAAAARQAAERVEHEQRERHNVVWVAGLAGNAKRNSLGSVTTKRLSEKRSSAIVSPTAAGGGRDEDAIGSLLRHLKLQEDKPSPRTPGSKRGSRTQPPASPVKRLVHHQSAPNSKRASLVLKAELAEHAASTSTPPIHPLMSPSGLIASLMSPGGVGSPSRRRRSIPPRAPTAASASHALPSVEHLRAIPFSRPSVLPHAPSASSPLASPSHQSLTPISASSPLLSPIPAPPSPTTRRSSMPCQSAGPMQRFWSDTRQAEFNGRRYSGSKTSMADDRKEGEDLSQQRQDLGVGIAAKPIKQVRWRDDVEYEGRPRAGTADAVVLKTAADPNYSWLPIGTSLRVDS